MSKISYTAAYIAVKFYGLTKNPRLKALFPSFIVDFYEKMVRFLPRHLRWYQHSLNSPFWRRFFIWSEELLLPGDLMHIISRKYYMTKEVDRALADDFEQVVILGAGFDHLGTYVAKKGIPAFELDIPSMIREKSMFLKANGYQKDLLRFLPIDVNEQRIRGVLRTEEAFDPKKKTLFLAEGFFDYLGLTPSEQILEDIRLMNRHNKLITTFFSLDELNLFHRFVFTSGVTMVGETLKFKLEKEEFVAFLEEMNFCLEHELSHQEIRKKLLKPNDIRLPILKGFYILHFRPNG